MGVEMQFRMAGLASAMLALSACSSEWVTVAPQAPTTVTHLGHAQAQACGSLGFLSTAYYVVPMGLNSRVQRAYDKALASVPGATALTDVSYQEDWAWWLLGTARCVTISGEAVK